MKKILLLALFAFSGAFAPVAQADLCANPFDEKEWKAATPDSISCIDANARDLHGHTPLHYAAKHSQNPEIFPPLITHWKDVNAKNNNGQTPLHYAAGYNDNPAITALLIDRGAYINAKDKDGMTPAHYSFNLNNFAILKLLFEKKADLLVQDNLGKSVLKTILENCSAKPECKNKVMLPPIRFIPKNPKPPKYHSQIRKGK